MSRLFAFVNLGTGNVDSLIDIGLFATQYKDGQIQGDHIMLDVSDRDDLDVLMTERSYKDGVWISRPAQPSQYHDWDNEAEAWIMSERLMIELRTERNARLAASDWTQLPDSPLTDEQKQAWSEYRQALRDMMSQDEPVFPEAP